MIVFKGYLKILNKNKLSILLYLGIFTLLTFIMSRNKPMDFKTFEAVKTEVAWIDHDQTEFTASFKEYLKAYATFKEIDEKELEDAFFYREIEVIVEIPKGFTAALLNENPMTLSYKMVPDSASSFTFQNEAEKYLNFAVIYLKHELPTDNLNASIQQHLNQGPKVTLTEEHLSDFVGPMSYFNFLAYILVALIVTVIGVIMYSFKSIEIKRRLHLSALSYRRINFILIVGNLLLGITLYLALMILSAIVLKDLLFTTQGLLFSINAFIFMLNTIALAYLIASIFDSINVISALGTICSLGFSFVTGIFIPQEFLDPNLLKITRIIPSYWYVHANGRIATISKFNSSTLTPIYNSYGILLGSAIIFVLIALIVSKVKQRSES